MRNIRIPQVFTLIRLFVRKNGRLLTWLVSNFVVREKSKLVKTEKLFRFLHKR